MKQYVNPNLDDVGEVPRELLKVVQVLLAEVVVPHLFRCMSRTVRGSQVGTPTYKHLASGSHKGSKANMRLVYASDKGTHLISTHLKLSLSIFPRSQTEVSFLRGVCGGELGSLVTGCRRPMRASLRVR